MTWLTDSTGILHPQGRSLLGRVFLRMSLTMLAAIILIVVVLFVEFKGHIDTMRDRSLGGQAADVARHVQFDDAGNVSVDLPAALAQAYGAESGRYRYAVLDNAGRLLAGSHGVSGPLDPDGLLLDGPQRFFATLDEQTGRQFYGASIAHPNAQSPLSIQVQQSEHDDVVMDSFLDELGDEVAWIVVLVFAAILLVTYWTLRASLSSLTEVSRQAAAIGPDTLDQRLRFDEVPAEVRPIVFAVNAALDRLEKAFHQQRRFTADAAHEMRTPIAILRAHLATLSDSSAHGLESDLIALERVVAQLLKLAQVDSLRIAADAKANLHEVAVHVAMLMGPVAIARGLGIAVSGDENVVVHGDSGALEVVLRNLVENALNHSPDGAEVEVVVNAQAHSICVMDRGPGVSEADRERIFERFWRHPQNNANGAGLGLSIVSRIADASAARVTVDARQGGGAMFTVTFPG